jgi:hypothetical protein
MKVLESSSGRKTLLIVDIMIMSVNGRKIDPCYENPIDNAIINICEWCCPWFKKFNFTPNGITTIGNIFGVIGLFALNYEYPYIFIISVTLSYFFDCLDGHYARKYDMCSWFGDMYDHISDILFLITYGYLHYTKFYAFLYDSTTMGGVVFLLFTVFLLLAMGKHIGCQELWHEKLLNLSGHAEHPHKSSSLNFLKNIAREEDIHWTRYFGIGTGFLVFHVLTFTLLCV